MRTPAATEGLPTPDPDGQHLEVALDSSIADVEKFIAKAKSEVAAAFGEDGVLLFAPRLGIVDEVMFSDDEIDLMSGANATITHNHPSGEAMFSPSDIMVARKVDAAQIRISLPDGRLVSASRPKRGWPSTNRLQNLRDAAIESASKARDRAERDAVRSGRRPSVADLRAVYNLAVSNGIRDGLSSMGIVVVEE